MPPGPGGGTQGRGTARPQHCPSAGPRCAHSGRLGGRRPDSGGAERPRSHVGAVSVCFREVSVLVLCLFFSLFLSVCHGGCQAPHAARSYGSHTFPPVPRLPFPSDGGFFGFTEVLKLNVAHPVSAACPAGSVSRSSASSWSLGACRAAAPLGSGSSLVSTLTAVSCVSMIFLSSAPGLSLSNSPARGFGS